jgi:ssDNA-binding replication factor A large subunit
LKIVDLKAGQGKVDIEIEVIEISDAREFSKFGKDGRVATARVKDDSGEMDLTLWNENIDEISVGNKVKIENGYVSEFQGNPQLTAGKFGSLTVIE